MRAVFERSFAPSARAREVQFRGAQAFDLRGHLQCVRAIDVQSTPDSIEMIRPVTRTRNDSDEDAALAAPDRQIAKENDSIQAVDMQSDLSGSKTLNMTNGAVACEVANGRVGNA